MTPGRWRLAAVAAALALLAGGSSPDGRQAVPARPVSSQTTVAAPRAAPRAAEAVRGFRSVRSYRPAPVPTRLEIPRIVVASPLGQLGRAPDGTVEVPARWEVAGWYERGPRPGDPGSAVILGHVDSRRGPAVFHRLKELRAGDEIIIGRADRSSVRFVVEQTGQYDKRRFPTEDVYYPTLVSALRLVTCGGEFDSGTGHYRSNVIVFAGAEP
jgi:sortase (surface protein transpeptidase)